MHCETYTSWQLQRFLFIIKWQSWRVPLITLEWTVHIQIHQYHLHVFHGYEKKIVKILTIRMRIWEEYKNVSQCLTLFYNYRLVIIYKIIPFIFTSKTIIINKNIISSNLHVLWLKQTLFALLYMFKKYMISTHNISVKCSH